MSARQHNPIKGMPILGYIIISYISDVQTLSSSGLSALDSDVIEVTSK